MSTLPDITVTPTSGQRLAHDGKEYNTIREGLAHILVPSTAAAVPQNDPRGESQSQSVFYNPIQQFNRDLSVLAIRAYGEGVLERKRKSSESGRQKFAARRKEKKRKRDDELIGARKAGRLGEMLPVQMDIEAPDEQIVKSETSDTEHKATFEDQTAVENGAATNQTIPPESIAEENQLNTEEKKPMKPPSFTILDALSATGLRALRYAHEIPFTTAVTANDLLPEATKMIRLNAQHNGLSEKITAVTGNALAHMYSRVGEECEEKGRPRLSSKYDVIDLDPYGTAAPFLDAAVQSVRDDGGLLCVTCTDAGVWASNGYPEKCYSLYGGIPLKGLHSHEGGLRLILHSIATAAARYGLAIEPLLSLSIDFYARVFVQIYKSPADVKFLAGRTMMVYNCDSGCGAWTTQFLAKNKLSPNKKGTGHFWKHTFSTAPVADPTCQHCGTKTHLAGPMYAGPLHSAEFIKKILDLLPRVSTETYQTTVRIEGMLTVALEEMLPEPEMSITPPPSATTPYSLDPTPFFIIPSSLAKIVHCITPHENALRGALRHLGYHVTRSHTKPGSIKTDAPWEVIWDVMRAWVKQKAPVRDGAVKESTAGWKILRLGEEREAAEVVFDEELGKDKSKGVVRYQLNPRENWGPMNRAGRSR